MRTIERASAFKKDFKRAKASPRHARDIDSLHSTVVALLAADSPLPEANRDHALGGEWRGYRDCHLKPDLVLIYRKPDPEILRLARSAPTANCSADEDQIEMVEKTYDFCTPL